MGFSTSQLDPNSQALFNSLTAKHMSSKVLQGKLITAGQELVDGVQGRFVSLKVSYSIAIRVEQITSGQF